MRPDATPELVVVVDTEEGFDWAQPFSRSRTAVNSVLAQEAAHEIFDKLGIVPTYMVDYPVAADDLASAFLATLARGGRATIGAHLHPWVTPPHEEIVSVANSYHCNLPPELERAKLHALTQLLGERFGQRPTIFKSGRYGLGPSTVRSLIETGYKIDCSVVPYTDFRADGGPSFLGVPDQPYWLDFESRLLEVPLTMGFLGWGRRFGKALQGTFDSMLARLLKVPGAFARTGFLERSRLSPEGVSSAEQCALLKALVASGHRTFSLTYHSPSLAPGNTPYVRNESDLQQFLTRIAEVLSYFRNELGGRYTTLPNLYRRYNEISAVAKQ